jgi:hypothetical protein
VREDPDADPRVRQRPPERPRRPSGKTGHALTAGATTSAADNEIDEDDEDETEVPHTPVRRLLSLAIGGFAVLLALGLIMGAQTAGVGSARVTFAVVVFGAQVLYIFASTIAMRPPGAKVVAVVGVLAALGADIAAIVPTVATIGPLGLVAAAGLVAGVLGQIVRKEGRIRVTESLGVTLVVVVGVVSFSTLIVLTRVPVGTQAIVVSIVASGIALSVARFADVVVPYPRLAPQVPRGSLGIVLGAMVGTGVAAFLGSYMVGLKPHTAAIVGMAAAGAAAFADLTVGFAETGRELAGDAPTMWLARHMQGPLAGFALAAPVAYLISILFLVPA